MPLSTPIRIFPDACRISFSCRQKRQREREWYKKATKEEINCGNMCQCGSFAFLQGPASSVFVVGETVIVLAMDGWMDGQCAFALNDARPSFSKKKRNMKPPWLWSVCLLLCVVCCVLCVVCCVYFFCFYIYFLHRSIDCCQLTVPHRVSSKSARNTHTQLPK